MGFGKVIPKSFEGIVRSFVVGVTDEEDNEKDEVNPTESIHNSHSPSNEYPIRKATVPETAPKIIGIKLGPSSFRNP
jgi:hypothetical protein